MLGPMVALALLAPQGQTQSAAALLTKMFSYYSDAKVVSGKAKMVQSAAGHSVTIDTDFQYEKPAKLFVRQTLSGSQPRRWLVTSDGRYFSYDAPVPSDQQPRRLVEPVSEETSTVTGIYHATGTSLGDRNLVLDLTMGDDRDWKFIRSQWATLEYGGKTKLGDVDVNVIKGTWREYQTAPASAQFTMFVTDEGQLKAYKMHEVVSVGNVGQQAMPPTPVDTQWEFTVDTKAKPDASLFAIVK